MKEGSFPLLVVLKGSLRAALECDSERGGTLSSDKNFSSLSVYLLASFIESLPSR